MYVIYYTGFIGQQKDYRKVFYEIEEVEDFLKSHMYDEDFEIKKLLEVDLDAETFTHLKLVLENGSRLRLKACERQEM